MTKLAWLKSLVHFKRPDEGDRSQYWFSRFSSPIIFLILVLASAGVYQAFTIPVSVFPETSFPRVVVGIDNGVMPIDQMLVTITRPIEEAVNSVPGLQQVRSITSRGQAEVDLFFSWNVDMIMTLQLVDSALAQVQAELPPTAKIDSHRLTFASFPILGYSVTSDNIPQTDLWELATYTLKPRLNRLDGVATVVVQGGQEPEYHIIPDPAKMLVASVTVSDLLDAVRRTNLIDSPGLLPKDHFLYLALVNGQVKTPDQIGQIVIKSTQTGIPVRIVDVASVEKSVKPVYTMVMSNGKPAILLSIDRQPTANALAVATEAHDEIERLRTQLPPGVHIAPFYDQSIIVSESIKSVRDAILLGLALASIIMVIFLRDWGTSIVAGLVIPVTVLVTLIVLRLLGQSFNLMTLGGLAAAVGLVIDDAIVVVENIVLHRDAGQPRLQAIASALREITVPLIGSTVTPIVVFLPLISMEGVEGVFFRALAVTVAAALMTSLLLALTWTPNLSQYFISSKSRGTNQSGEITTERLLKAEEASLQGFFGRVVRVYERALKFSLERPGWIAIMSLLLVAGAYLSYRLIGSDLLPAMDEGAFILDYISPPGTSLNETNQMLLKVDKILNSVPEVESTTRRTGLQLGLAAVTEANTGDFSVKLKQKRSRSVDQVIEEVRAKIAERVPALDVEFSQMLQDMIGDLSNAPEPVQIKLFSEDAALLNTWGPKVADAIGKIQGVVDIKNGVEDATSGPALTFQVDPASAARAGFTPEEVSVDASAILEGEPAPTPVVANDRAYTIRVRYPDQNRATLDAMSNTLLNSASGHTATLGSLSTLTQVPGQTEIRRENLQRDLTVTARLEGRDLGSGMADVQRTMANLHLPASIHVLYGGTYEEQQRSFRELIMVLLLAIVLVFLVLLFEFRNFSAPTAILSSALLSTAGVFFGLLVTGTTFNISSFMGLIMVIGIVAKNGILLLDADQKFRSWDFTPEDAMIQAGRRRLRPIVMTALATVAGMLPLALAIGAGSQMLQPLAIAVIGGVLISMVLSLIITPTVYFRLTRKQESSGTGHAPEEH
ncbi:MAG TPA: efflux RND transporter permease subunit [Candidatus Sulfotelmatobacter sp.]|nr:efflux RND transporter permease subunit [Candidatus Sulfotelmatobacter sp.]